MKAIAVRFVIAMGLAGCLSAAASEAHHPRLDGPVVIDDTGAFIGHASMSDFNTDDDVWIRRGALHVDGHRLRLQTRALICRGDAVLASASDGGFYEYDGEILEKDGQTTASLWEVRCDNCGEQTPPPSYTLSYRVVDNDTVVLGGVRMARAASPAEPERCPLHDHATTLPPESPADRISR